jgi:hypothetical protein
MTDGFAPEFALDRKNLTQRRKDAKEMQRRKVFCVLLLFLISCLPLRLCAFA